MEFLFHSQRLYSAVNLTRLQHASTETGWTYSQHRHMSFEFLYCIKGIIKQHVGDTDYVLYPGECMIIRAGVYHDTNIIENAEFLGFHIDIEDPNVSSIFQNTKQVKITINDGNTFCEIDESIQKILKRFSEIFILGKDTDLSLTHDDQIIDSINKLEIHSMILSIIYKLSMHFLKEYRITTKNSINNLAIAESVAKIIEDNIMDQFFIQTISDELHLHRTHITNVFKKVYGISPKMYYNQLKIKRAKQMLLETEDSIDSISEALSFSSSGHFSRFFSSMTGTTPSNFRNRNYTPIP